MPNYRIRLQWTAQGLEGNKQGFKDARIDDSIRAATAGDRNVKGHGGNDPLSRAHRNEEGDGQHVQWHVNGPANDVKYMVDEWVSNGNVTLVSIIPNIP